MKGSFSTTRTALLGGGLLALILAMGNLSSAQPVVSQDVRMLDAKARWETLNLIRRDKFNLILPGAMRDNGIDMWITRSAWATPTRWNTI